MPSGRGVPAFGALRSRARRIPNPAMPSTDAPESAPDSPSPSLLDLVRRIHAERLTGLLEVALPEARRRLHFVDGELHLPADHPLAGALRPLLGFLGGEESEGRGRSGAAEVRALMTRIAFLLQSWSHGDAAFQPGEEAAESELVGPLPTVLLIMEWAAGADEESLLASLGGEGARVASVDRRDPPAVLAARLLDPQAAVLLSRLSRPGTVDDLLRQSAAGRSRLLADLARLRAAGLVRVEGGDEAAEEAPSTGVAPPPVAPDVVRRFADRIGRELRSRPLVLDVDSHRSRVGDLLSRAGGMTAYELLGVGSAASETEVHEAFRRVARLSHPSHAERLSLGDDERPLWILFEQATAAYLTLSQLERRRRYDERLAGMGRGGPAAAGDGGSQKNLAHSYYERAEALIDAEDFHFAIELLKQAVHTHPRPEYYVLLGRAQAKNPNWLRHALDSYRKALDLGAEGPRVSVALGRLCEEMENYDEARRHYEAALAKNPAEPDARAGMARLSARQDEEGGDRPRRFSLGGLFRSK